MAEKAHSVGSIAVNNQGTSGMVAGVIQLIGPLSIHQSSDGAMSIQTRGDNNALPIAPAEAGVALSMEDIFMVSEKLGGDYIHLGPLLHISAADMDFLHLDCTSHGHKYVVTQMLRKWRQAKADEATRNLLAKKLRVIRRVDIALLLEQRP